MKKFYVQHLKGKTSILEIEGEVLHSLDLKGEEYVFLISKPESLKGERYMWWCMRDTEAEALKVAYRDIDEDLKMRASKGKLKEDEIPTIVLQEKAAVDFIRLK
jgi:hypothetical protein